MHLFRQLATIIRMELIGAIAYPANVFIYVLSGAIGPIVALAVWYGLSVSGGNLPMSLSSLTTYYVLLLIVELFSSAWATPFVSADIRYGKLSSYLLRPASYFAFQFGTNIGEKMFKISFLLPIVITIAVVLKFENPSVLPGQLALFFISWLFAAILNLLVSVSIGLTSFWLDDSSALDDFHDLMYFIFSGRVIPIIALPLFLQPIGYLLPFRYILSFPLEIIIGRLDSTQLFGGFMLQIFYLVLAVVVVRFLWTRGLRRYSSVGA